ncbi:MAG: threonine ammonia-lyase, partial [Dehalococcoidia bacterium]|nr:threonine ammonia-lyase [Dehalococcoidia bacterium]
MRAADPETLKAGVWTASTGNMAQGVAWAAREMGLECTVAVPGNTPVSELE